MSCEILSLISGKGGVGKTSLAVNMAHFMAQAGLKVLLIDCDRFTCGATLFYEMMGKLPQDMKGYMNFCGLLQSILDEETFTGVAKEEWSKPAIPMHYGLDYGLDFIPAGSRAGEEPLTVEKINTHRDVFFQRIEQWMNEYQIIILDHGAGENDLISFLLHCSTVVLLVGAPNQLSEKSTQNMYKKTYDVNRRILYCINKIPASQYEEMAKIINNPYDIVRKVAGFELSDKIGQLITTGKYVDAGLSKTGQCLKNLCSVTFPTYSDDIRLMMTRLEMIRRKKEEEEETARKELWLKKIGHFHAIAILSGLLPALVVFWVMEKNAILKGIICYFSVLIVGVAYGIYELFKNDSLKYLHCYYSSVFSGIFDEDADSEDDMEKEKSTEVPQPAKKEKEDSTTESTASDEEVGEETQRNSG